MSRVTRSAGRVVHGVVVALIAFAAVNVLWDAAEESTYRSPDALGVVLALTATLPLLVVHGRPWLVMGITAVAVGALTFGDYSRWVATAGVALAAAAIALRRPLGEAAGATILAFSVAALAMRDEPYIDGSALAALMHVGVPVGLALVMRRWTYRVHEDG